MASSLINPFNKTVGGSGLNMWSQQGLAGTCVCSGGHGRLFRKGHSSTKSPRGSGVSPLSVPTPTLALRLLDWLNQELSLASGPQNSGSSAKQGDGQSWQLRCLHWSFAGPMPSECLFHRSHCFPGNQRFLLHTERESVLSAWHPFPPRGPIFQWWVLMGQDSYKNLIAYGEDDLQQTPEL